MTLNNLLSLRNGGPIGLAGASDIRLDTNGEIDIDADDTSRDSEKCDVIAGNSADTATIEKLRRRFLDRLAELFAAGRNGTSVTAAMLREVEREDHVDIWLARNNGFQADEDKKMIQETETMLYQNAGGFDPGRVTMSFRTKAIEYCSQRLEFYEGELRKRLVASQPRMREIIGLSDDEPDIHIIRNMYTYFFEPRDASETRLQRLEHLAALGAEVRRAVHKGRSFASHFGGSVSARKAITM